MIITTVQFRRVVSVTMATREQHSSTPHHEVSQEVTPFAPDDGTDGLNKNTSQQTNLNNSELILS